MRRRLPLGVLAILVLAVASLPAASASSSQAGSSAGDKKVEVIRVIEVTVQEAFIDVGEEGDSVGDYFTFASDLVRHGKKVGTDGGVGTIVRLEPDAFTVHFAATAELPKGQITTQGLGTITDGPLDFELAITGGTGRYRTAHGTLSVEDIGESETVLTFRVIR
jgi:hypothetical protein